MKKLLIIIAFILGRETVSAQIVGIESGPTISKINWTNSMIKHTTFYENVYTGYYANLGITYLQKKYIELSSYVGYTNAGGKGWIRKTTIDYPEIVDTVQTRAALGLIDLGSEIRAKYLIGKYFVPFIQLGFELNYLAAINESPVKLLGQFEEYDQLNKFLFYANFSAGLFYNINHLRIGLDYQYNQALNKMVDVRSQLGITTVIGLKYSMIGISLGYRIY